MRVSVTITEEMNKTITKLAKEQSLSKDKYLSKVIAEYLDHVDDNSEGRNPYDSEDLADENARLRLENQALQRLVARSFNERGAGRKPRFDDEQIAKMKDYREKGYTIQAIANIFDCGVATVHKLISE